MAAFRRVYDSVTCRLTAKNWDQLRNPTLGNRVWASFTFFSRTSESEALEFAAGVLKLLAKDVL